MPPTAERRRWWQNTCGERFAFAGPATTDLLTGVVTWAYKSHPLPIGDEEFAAAEGRGDGEGPVRSSRRCLPGFRVSLPLSMTLGW